MKLRVYFITHKAVVDGPHGPVFLKEKCARDFPDGTTLEQATEELYNEFGQLSPDRDGCVRKPYAEIVSHGFAKEEPDAQTLETFTATEASLFTPEMARETLSESPRMRSRRWRGEH